MIRLRSNSEIEAQIERTARLQLRSWRNFDLGYRERIGKVLAQKPATLSWTEYIRLTILHRQFSGAQVPGMSYTVRAARVVLKGYRAVRPYRGES